MREALAFGTWMQNAQVQPGETMRLMADRYMEVTFPGDADRRPSQRHRNYPTVRSTVIDRLLPFLNTHYGDPNACTTALSQPVVQRPVVQRTSLPVTDVMRLFLDDHNFMAALNDQVIHHSGLAAFSSSGMLIEIRNFGAWLRVARAQPGETLAQMAERYLDATFPLDAAAAPARRPARYGPARRAIVTHLLPFMNSFLDATNASTAPPQPANNSGDEMEQE